MTIVKTIVAIGGGELRTKETYEIDSYIAQLAKNQAGTNQPIALFVPTASHDSLPYFNSFRKTYSRGLKLKSDVALLTKKNIPLTKIATKIKQADMIYVGGGNTLFMLQVWQETGVDQMIIEAYNRGAILSGLSAGAICWFEKIYTDSEILSGTSDDYKVYDALGLVPGLITPHYQERQVAFDNFLLRNSQSAIALEDNSAIIIKNGVIKGSIGSKGRAYHLQSEQQIVNKIPIRYIDLG